MRVSATALVCRHFWPCGLSLCENIYRPGQAWVIIIICVCACVHARNFLKVSSCNFRSHLRSMSHGIHRRMRLWHPDSLSQPNLVDGKWHFLVKIMLKSYLAVITTKCTHVDVMEFQLEHVKIKNWGREPGGGRWCWAEISNCRTILSSGRAL